MRSYCKAKLGRYEDHICYKACPGSLVEKSMLTLSKEAKEGVIELKAIEASARQTSTEVQVEEDFSLDHPDLIGIMLKFMYTGTILSAEQTLAASQKKNAEQRKKAFASDGRENEFDLSLYSRLFSLGSKYDVPQLREATIRLFRRDAQHPHTQFTDAIRALHIAFYTGSDGESQMWDCAFEGLLKNIERAVMYEPAAKAIEQIPGLPMKLVVAMAKEK
jgi:hypothetical protein